VDAFRILSLGYDSTLMPVRTMLLKRAGYQVVEASSCPQALAEIGLDSIDLVVICHSVPADEQKRLIAQVKSIRPDLTVLCLTWKTIYIPDNDCKAVHNMAPEFLEDGSQALPHPGRA
jgi:DNA-binding NtrC family response regulator